jgi:hypothetical protein
MYLDRSLTGSRESERIPGFDDIEPSIKLEDREAFVGLFDRTKEVLSAKTEKYGKRYTIALVGLDGPHKGKLCTLEGGARLYEGIARAIGPVDKPLAPNPCKLRFTQRGSRGTTSSTIEVELVR